MIYKHKKIILSNDFIYVSSDFPNRFLNGANEKIKKLIFYKDYINDLSNKIHKEDMYFNKIYFCLNRESKNIQETLKNMNTIGVFFKKLKREEIKSVLGDFSCERENKLIQNITTMINNTKNKLSKVEMEVCKAI